MSDGRERLAAALPRYAIGDELGRGGWGVVYRAEHRELGRSVAVKQLSPAVGANDEARARFVTEARLVASLVHPHIVPVYDFVDHDGVCAIVMELATGGSLSDRLEGGLRADEAIAIVLAVASGLDHAHAHRLLHRDIKPDNVLFADGAVKLTDFGIAKVLDSETAGMTATGSIIGTPTYMAPEQVSGGELSPATDVYALAVVLYRLLAGEFPYPRVTDSVAQLFQHVHEPARPLRSIRPEIDPGVAAVVHRGLAKDPAERPPTAQRFAVELAAATRVRLGAGWLDRTGVAVMGANSILSAAEHAADHADGAAHAGHTFVDPPSGGGPTVAAPPPGGLPPYVEPATSGSPVGRGDPAPATVVHGAEPPTHGRTPFRVALAAAAVLGLVLAGLAVVALLRGDDDSPTADPGSDTTETDTATDTDAAAVTPAELERFTAACAAAGVSEERCGCAADRVDTDLDPDEFRRGLQVIEGDGQSLTPELERVFQACVDDGF